MFSPHPTSAVEYWFFKVNSGPVALIVDWIERRKLNEHELRVSIHSPQGRRVIFEKLDALMPDDNFISPKRTRGRAGDISWDLIIDLGGELIKPDIFPVGLLKMPDTLYESAPMARFTGWIRHGTGKFTLERVCGSVTQYWGRQLIPEWWWLSAHQFDAQDVAVECSIFRTSLWGTSVQIPFAFLYLYRNGKGHVWMAPPNTAKAEGSPDKFILEFICIGRKKITLVAAGREYGDFGERIINTLTGDLEIFEGGQRIAHARGTAGLERRAPEHRPHRGLVLLE
ncbi:MAG: hypothetical protein K8S20_04965 [Chloroflexi bacterium]|nr:hypothetical protein [Chloroflexota bacterium]